MKISKFNIEQRLLINPQLIFLCLILGRRTAIFAPGLGYNLGSRISVSCNISFVSFNLDHFLILYFSSPWYYLRLQLGYFMECLAFWICQMFLQDEISVMHFWQECHRSYVSFSIHNSRRHTIRLSLYW